MLRRFAKVPFTLAALLMASLVSAQSEDAVWVELLRVTGHAQGVRAAFTYQCREHLASAPRQMATVCAKLPRIPDQVVESALVPYAKRYVSAAQAKDAIATWGTPESQALVQKVLRDVEGGGREPLAPEEVSALRSRSDTDFGRALLTLGKDQDALRAAARAMGAYEP